MSSLGNLRRNLLILASLILAAASAPAQTGTAKVDPTVDEFLSRFREAVARSDRKLVASMVKFPLQMPYGVSPVRSSAEFIRRYGAIFDRETRICFATAEPQPEVKGVFTISCGEAMLYRFEKVKREYRMTTVDNVNE